MQKFSVSAQKLALSLAILLIAAFFLAMPSLAHAAENGQLFRLNITETITVQREDGSIFTVDSTGNMNIGYRGRQIVIDVISAGVVRETDEQVDINILGIGTWQLDGNQVQFGLSGPLIVRRGNGNNIVIDVISAGVVSRQSDAVFEFAFSGEGAVRGSGENIVIDVIGAGVTTK